MEQSIKEQLFGTASVAIQIEEFYVLSELYTLETLLAEYKESLVLELEKFVAIIVKVMAFLLLLDILLQKQNLIFLLKLILY